MKKLVSITITLFLFSTLLAGAVIVEFSANADAGKIVVTWKASVEENVLSYVIERSTDEKNFFKIGEVLGRGAGYEYEFVDNQLGKVNNGSYYYRIGIQGRDGTYVYYDQIVWASTAISSMKRTWGSIKALFR